MIEYSTHYNIAAPECKADITEEEILQSCLKLVPETDKVVYPTGVDEITALLILFQIPLIHVGHHHAPFNWVTGVYLHTAYVNAST